MKKNTRKRQVKGGLNQPRTPNKTINFASYLRTSNDTLPKQLFPEIGTSDRSRKLTRDSIQPERDRHNYGHFDKKDFLPEPDRGRRRYIDSIQLERDRHDYMRFDKKDFSPEPDRGGKSKRSSYKRKTIRRKQNVKK